MSQNISAVIESAKQLVHNLKQDDTAVEKLHTDAMCILRKLEAMKEYNDEVAIIESQSKPHNTRSALVSAIQQENRQIKDLKRENIELAAALEDHQSTLQMIMTKYRQHVLQLTQSKEVEQACASQMSSGHEVHRLADKISEMAGVMRLAADIDESNHNTAEEQLAHFKTENEVLRELLLISPKSGNLRHMEGLRKEDKPRGPTANGNGFTTIKKATGGPQADK